jgi:hypothetical protein
MSETTSKYSSCWILVIPNKYILILIKINKNKGKTYSRALSD